jgi:hypothetical protein
MWLLTGSEDGYLLAMNRRSCSEEVTGGDVEVWGNIHWEA